MFFAHSARENRTATLPASSRLALFERTRKASTFICARRVLAAERYAPDAGARLVDACARREIVEHRFHRLLVFRADREIVLGLALPRPVEGKRREAAREEAVLVVVHLFLRRIETHAHDDDGRLRDRAGRLRRG